MGHSASLTKIRYYGQNGQQILSASEFLFSSIYLASALRARISVLNWFGIYNLFLLFNWLFKVFQITPLVVGMNLGG